MTLVQQIRITQKDQYEQNSNWSRISKPTSLNQRHPKGPAPITTHQKVMNIVQQIIKQNPQTLKLLNNGKKGVK